MASSLKLVSESTVNMEKDDDNCQEGITVAIRMRPLNRTEGDKERIWKVLSKHRSITQTTNSGKPLSDKVTGRTFFTFDKVFGEEENTTQVYDSVAKGIVSSVVNGLNGTVFAYGQTSSGKTYTMQGSGSIQEGASTAGGVVHMAAKDIFSQITLQHDRMFLVRASFLEIYNEEVRDLLSDSSQTLPIREDPQRGVFVQSQEEIVTDFESLLKMLFIGEKSRAIASTCMNERSSRSHTIFRITIESREKEEDENAENRSSSDNDGAVRISTLNLVDLAGSESVRHTGATGERQKEGGMINQSLLTLSRVMVALGQPNQMHINFRDSKLTRILQPSLSGNARMAVICCATPSELYLEETRSTLQFASRAKLVKTNAQVNEVLDDRSIIRRLQRELAEARRNGTAPGNEHLRDLETKAATADTAAIEAQTKLKRLKASILDDASYLFGSQGSFEPLVPVDKSTEAVTYNLRSRKRRQSDGYLIHSHLSPSKTIEQSVGTPKTAPRKKKGKISRHVLSPRSELSLVRQALSSRNELSTSLQRSLVEQASLLASKESEMEKLVSQNSELADEKFQASSEIETLRQTMSSIQSNVDDTVAEYDFLIAEKESVIIESFQKIEAENKEKIRSETSNLLLVEQLETLQQRFDDVQEERIRSAFDLAQCAEKKEEDKKVIHEMNGKIASMTSTMIDSEQERDAAEATIRDLQEQLSSTSTEKEVAVNKASSLEHDNVSVKAFAEEARLEADKMQQDSQEQLDAAVREKRIALENIARLTEDLTRAKESATGAENKSKEFETTAEETHKGLKTELESVQAEKNDAFDRVVTLEEDISRTEEELVNTKSCLVAFEQASIEEREQTEKTIGDLQEKMESIETSRNDLQSEKVSLQQELIIHSQTTTSLKEQNSLLQNQHLELQHQESQLSRQVGELEGVLSETQQQGANHISQLEESNSVLFNAKTEMASSLDELENIVCGLRTQTVDQGEEISALEAELCTVNEHLHYSEQEREVMAFEVDTCQAQNSEFEDRLCRTEETKKECESLILSLEEELSTATALLDARLIETRKLLGSRQDQLELSEARLQELESEKQAIISEGEESRECLEKSLNDSQSAVATLQAENETIQTECVILRQEVSGIQSKYVSLRTQVTAKEIEKSEYVNHIGSLTNDLEALRSENSDLVTAFQKVQKLEASLQQDLTTSREQITQIEADQDAILVDKDGIFQEQSEAFERVCLEKHALDSALELLQSSFTDLATRFKDLGIAHSALTGENDILQDRLSTLNEEKVELDRFLVAAEEESHTLLEQRAAMESELPSLHATIDTLKNDLASSQSQAAQFSAEKRTAAADQASLVQSLERDLESEKKHHDDLETGNAMVNDKLAKRNEETESQLAELEERHDELEANLAESQQNYDTLRLENRDTHAKLSSFEVEKIEMQSRIMALESERMAALAEKDSMEVDQKDEQEVGEERLALAEEQIGHLGAEKFDALKQLEFHRAEFEHLKLEHSKLTTKNDEAKVENDGLQSHVEDLEQRAKDVESTKDDIKGRLLKLELEKSVLHADFESVQAQLSEEKLLGKNIADLQSRHEKTQLALEEHQRKLEQTTSSKANAIASLKAREDERNEAVNALDELYQKNQELVRNLAASLPQERDAELTKEISELKVSNTELQQLLVSTNEAEERFRGIANSTETELKAKERELEDAQYRLAQLEEELRQSEIAFEERLNMDKSKTASDGHETLLRDIQALEHRLQQELIERENAEENMKKQMGDEQRLLIQEGEKMMEALRSKSISLEKKLADSETEAYSSRQALEETRDQKKSIEQTNGELQTSTDSMNETIARQETQLSALHSDLNKTRAECYALKESSIEMKDKVRKASRDCDRADREREMASSELAVLKRKISSLERSVSDHQSQSEKLKVKLRSSAESEGKECELSDTIKDLQQQIKIKQETLVDIQTSARDLKAENENLSRNLRELQLSQDTTLSSTGNSVPGSASVDTTKLRGKIEELASQLKQKDRRVKKLEMLKMTKEHAQMVKNIRADNARLAKEISQLNQGNKSLQSQLSSLDDDSELRTELSELRFDKNALESKLRKYAAHCQRLEDDRAGMADALRSCKIDPADYDEDVNEALVALCDKFTSLEQGRAPHSMRSSKGDDKLLAEKESLESKVGTLLASEERLVDKVAKYEARIEDLKRKMRNMADTNDDATGENCDMGRKLRFLEQENLQLMLDVKTAKKQLQNSREEVEMLRMNAMDNSTLDFGTVDLASHSSDLSRQTKTSKEGPKIPKSNTRAKSLRLERGEDIDKENTVNVPAKRQRVSGEAPFEKARRAGAAPGLGESAVQGDETGECKQS